MKSNLVAFDLQHTLNQIKHYLPSQAPLKDFIHHNTLHAFQDIEFHEAMQKASKVFGYTTYLSLQEYRALYANHKINPEILIKVIQQRKTDDPGEHWQKKLLTHQYDTTIVSRIGKLRSQWKVNFKININKNVHPILFRILGSYIDQGIAQHFLPFHSRSFLGFIREIEKNSFKSLFKSERTKSLLENPNTTISSMLRHIVGDERQYFNYLFDQQFAHPGWSGMVSYLEDHPESLTDKRNISLEDVIFFELLLEIDFLESRFGSNWEPLIAKSNVGNYDLLAKVQNDELFDVLAMWQEAYEWSYYDQVLNGLKIVPEATPKNKVSDFQALFCLDDRSCSMRRYLEEYAPSCETFGTAGFFNVVFNFQPEYGKFLIKSCPAPLTPSHIIKESNAKLRHKKEIHFNSNLQNFLGGYIYAQTSGFFSALKLAKKIFYPTKNALMVSSFAHMDKDGKLSIESSNPPHHQHNMQVGFTIDEMTKSIKDLLMSIGLVDNFAPLVYIVGHGASSVNNTYYAGYDCGACSGRAGSVNAKVAANMANNPEVRTQLYAMGIQIPEETVFIGALHDTTMDEIEFYDLDQLTPIQKELHEKNAIVFDKALDCNAKERSRRFLLVDSKADAATLHNVVRKRAMSLFEPRPEWNHATNCLCIIGNRENNKFLNFDRRAFLNSYDYKIDPNGDYMLGILKAVAPVCGGINLEYYFSKVDSYRLGAGSKLPHNVMGLVGLTNGIDGDLRPGLPLQMVNIHEPLRLLVIIENTPELISQVLERDPATAEWFLNHWIHLVAIEPESRKQYRWLNGKFEPYTAIYLSTPKAESWNEIIENSSDSLPVYQIVS